MSGQQLVWNRNVIKESIQVARMNWAAWRDVYEHGGTVQTNPLLTNENKFASFCQEYSVSRTIRKGTRNEFRRSLIKRIPVAIREDSGRALDELEQKLRLQFGTHNGTRRMISVLSKVAAFVRPEQFVPWDSYAKRGLKTVLALKGGFETYAAYLQAFDVAWNGASGRQLRQWRGAQNKLEQEHRFLRRVFDICLMKFGGRIL